MAPQKRLAAPLPGQNGEQFHCSWVRGGADGLAGNLLDAEVPRGGDPVQCQTKLGFPGRAERGRSCGGGEFYAGFITCIGPGRGWRDEGGWLELPRCSSASNVFKSLGLTC